MLAGFNVQHGHRFRSVARTDNRAGIEVASSAFLPKGRGVCVAGENIIVLAAGDDGC